MEQDAGGEAGVAGQTAVRHADLDAVREPVPIYFAGVAGGRTAADACFASCDDDDDDDDDGDGRLSTEEEADVGSA